MSGICFYTKLSGWADTTFHRQYSRTSSVPVNLNRQRQPVKPTIFGKPGLRQPLDLTFVRAVSARIMKHTGGETTTSVGRYDTSLGDFRLGEDYDEVYPLADFRKIPLLLDNLCRTTDVQLTEAGVSQNIKIVANFMYDFMHIKPFGYCNLETGILLINFLELKEEHPLLILFADDRAELLNALKRGKISETPETLEAFILHEQIKFFNREI